MKASEFTIGDWVYIPMYHSDGSSGTAQINEIIKKHGTYYLKFGDFLSAEIDKCQPVPLTPEILEKNGFKKDGYSSLSPDYYLEDDTCSIWINLNSTCDKSKTVWCENKTTKFSVDMEESRLSLQKNPLFVHQLQHILNFCGIDKTIEL